MEKLTDPFQVKLLYCSSLFLYGTKLLVFCVLSWHVWNLCCFAVGSICFGVGEEDRNRCELYCKSLQAFFFFFKLLYEQRTAESLMSVKECGVFLESDGMNILEPVVAVDRKAVNCDSCRRLVALQCQVAFSRWVKSLTGNISDCLPECPVSLKGNNF